MTPEFLLAPRVVAVAAWTLALVVAAGVAVPRPRVGGRVVRAGIARAATPRANESRGWVAPDIDHQLETCAMGAAQGRSDWPTRTDGPPGVSLALAAAVRLAGPPPSRALAVEDSSPRFPRWLARVAAGRAPPLS